MSVLVDKYTDYIPAGNSEFQLKPRWLGWFRPHERTETVAKHGRTKQEFKDECDLNVLMKKYEKGPPLPVSRAMPRYVDAFDLPSYQEALSVMADAERAFASLPSRVRGEFDNDPEKFVAFASDEANIDKLRDWGLAPRPAAPPEPQEVRVVSMPDQEAGK